MITNRMTGEWLHLMADIEHEPEYAETEVTVVVECLPGLLRPQALDISPILRERLALEFAMAGAPIHV